MQEATDVIWRNYNTNHYNQICPTIYIYNSVVIQEYAKTSHESLKLVLKLYHVKTCLCMKRLLYLLCFKKNYYSRLQKSTFWIYSVSNVQKKYFLLFVFGHEQKIYKQCSQVAGTNLHINILFFFFTYLGDLGKK